MRRGYTVVETLLVLAVLAIGIRLALPTLREGWLRGEAVEVVETIRAVEGAARTAHRSGGADALSGAPAGVIPEGLRPHLPEAVAFQGTAWTLEWRHWTFGEALGSAVVGDGVGTVTVTIPDPALQEAFLRLAHPSLWLQVGDTFSFLVPGL